MSLLQLEEFNVVTNPAQQYFVFHCIQQLMKHLISLDIVDYKITSTIKLLFAKITVL